MRVALWSSGRHDLGIIAPVHRALAGRGLAPLLVAGGLHLGRHGRQRPETLAGMRVAGLVVAWDAGDDERAAARVAGSTTTALGDLLPGLGCEALLLVGDRSETLAAAIAATCLRLPVIHLHGGETTLGAIDNVCRHAVSQLAHLHCVAHDQAAARLAAMGLPPTRVRITGAPGLDAAFAPKPAVHPAQTLGRALGRPLLLVTLHPATLGDDPDTEAGALVAGISSALAGHPEALVVATRANQDAGGGRINQRLEEQAAIDSRWLVLDALGDTYHPLLAHAHAMVGNSSSGIIEAPAFSCPVVNIGRRQEGRLRCGWLRDVPPDPGAIAAAIADAIAAAPGGPRPARPCAYGDGDAARRVAAACAALAHLPAQSRIDTACPLEDPP